jgi:hypothetical protein
VADEARDMLMGCTAHAGAIFEACPFFVGELARRRSFFFRAFLAFSALTLSGEQFLEAVEALAESC